MKIDEVWVDVSDDDDNVSKIKWMPMKVILLTKNETASNGAGGETIKQSSDFVLCYHEATGETASIPFVLVKIKKIYDEKTKEFISISAPG